MLLLNKIKKYICLTEGYFVCVCIYTVLIHNVVPDIVLPSIFFFIICVPFDCLNGLRWNNLKEAWLYLSYRYKLI